MEKTILVTGGAGFIGSNFVRHIYNKYSDYRIIILDALTYAGHVSNLPINLNENINNERLSFWYGNVRNGELVDTLVSQSDIVVHFAAETHVTRSVYSYWSTYEIPAVIIRPFNSYGPYQHLEKAIPRFITSCILNEPIRVHGDGSAARDYIFVEDMCMAVNMIIHADIKRVRGEVFNVASGVHRSMLSIAHDVVRM